MIALFSFRWLLVFCLSIVFCSVSLLSSAQELPKAETYIITKIAVVNLNKVLREAAATSKVRGLLDEKRTEFQDSFAKKESDLVERERELNAKREIISESAFQEEVRAFQLEVGQIQQEIQFRRQSLDNAMQQAQDEIRQVAKTIITELAQKFSLDIVMNADQVIIFRNHLDLTDIVLDMLNERTKNPRLEIDETPISKGE